jgi:hypothetical protein
MAQPPTSTHTTMSSPTALVVGSSTSTPSPTTPCCGRSSGRTMHWPPVIWWRRQDVGWNWEKIKFEGGGFNLKHSEVTAKDTRERERERERDRHKMELPLSRGGATNFGWPYKLGIYTPKLGHESLRHITNIVRPHMESVNTAINPNEVVPNLNVLWSIVMYRILR